MRPRPAGWLAIVGAALMAVGGGILIATPPWSIAGAIVLVAASILLSLGIIWTQRRSWSEPWPPDVTPSVQKQLRRLRVLGVVNGVALVVLLAAAVYAITTQNWWQLLFAACFLLVGLNRLSTNRRLTRLLREAEVGRVSRST